MGAQYVMPFIAVMTGAALQTQRAALMAVREITNSLGIIMLANMTAGRALDANSTLLLYEYVKRVALWTTMCRELESIKQHSVLTLFLKRINAPLLNSPVDIFTHEHIASFCKS